MKYLTFLIAGIIIGATGFSLWGALTDKDEKQNSNPTSAVEQRAEIAIDGRQAIYLNAQDQMHVSENMREFLQGLSDINDAIADEDRIAINDVLMALSTADGDSRMRNKLPKEFRQSGRALRNAFQDLGALAEEASFPEIQSATNAIFYHCIACHGAYNIVEIPSTQSNSLNE